MKYSRRRRKPMKRWSRTSQTGKTQKAVGSLIPVIPETVRTRTVFFLPKSALADLFLFDTKFVLK